MRRKFITKHRTWAGYSWPLFVVAIILGAFVQWTPEQAKWFVMLVLTVFVGLSCQALLNRHNLRSRNRLMAQLAASRPDYHVLDDPGVAQGFVGALGAIDELQGARDPKMTNVISTPEWTYGDFTYNLYGHIRDSEYIKARVHYGIMTTKLPRELPNVFFDSIKARRRQFRFHFAPHQRHSLEGDFDKHFVTYFPDGYTIDSMSFISPEVMWALREARDYDIEIYGNRLFLYGPLYDPEQQLQDMSAKLAEIKKQLAKNVSTYRDERLPFAEGRKRVSAVAMSLKLSNFWKVVGIGAAIGYILLRIIIEIRTW